MAKQTSQINIAFLTKGEGEVAKAFKRLSGETTRLNRDFKSLSKDWEPKPFIFDHLLAWPLQTPNLSRSMRLVEISFQ